MRRIAATLLFVFSLVCCFTRPIQAQEGSATLTGFIQDSSKAVIPGVKVTAIETATNQRFEATTGKDGSYTIVSLPVGPYQMQIEKPGFKTILKDDLFLHTQDALEVNFQMAVGSTSETVTVNGATTNDSSAVSMTVTREFIENMPLNGRSFQDLIQLAPGAVDAQGSNGVSNGYYSINGQRSDSNNYTVDGVSANLGGLNNQPNFSTGAGLSGSAPAQSALGTTQSLASIDSLQEFTIQTSGYTAEYGRSPGGQVQFTTRSGSNHIHGSLFEYLRNTAFDAKSYYENYYAEPKAAEHQNDFGGTVGGPIVIPKLYDGKDKTFFFFSYEGLRLLLPDFESDYVPTQAFRSWASPNVQPFLNASPLPSPNSPGNQDGCTVPDPSTGQPAACDALFNYSYSLPNNLDNVSVRADQQLGKRLHAFLRYADTPSSAITPYPQNPGTAATNIHTWTAGLTANITNSLLDEVRFNSSHDGEESTQSMKSIGGSVPWARDLLIPAAYDSPYAYGGASFYVPGTSLYTSAEYLGAGTTLHQYDLVDSIIWTRGLHSIKFGVDWRHLTTAYANDDYLSLIEIQSLAAIQHGYATSLFVGARTPGKPVFNNLSLYAQDHWKINPRLSSDFGLRWEFNPPPGPSNGQYPITLTSSDIITAQLAPAGTKPYRTIYHDFAPRFGFAWDAIPSQSHALTIRGGFGIFFDTAQQVIGGAYASDYPFQANSPTQTNVLLPLSESALAPPSLNFPLTPPYPQLQGVSSPNVVPPYTEQWNLSLDETLNVRNTLTVSYVGDNGRKLLFTQYYESVPANPNFPDGLDLTSNAAQSSYNALQVQDTGRIANGLDLVASFTFAHALDNASTDASDYAPTWGNSDNDLRRVLNLALNYQMRNMGSGGWTRAFTRGWGIANRFSAQSGHPLNVYQDQYAEPNGMLTAYSPDLVPGVPIYLHGGAANVAGRPVSGGWRLNPAAFALVPSDPNTGLPLRQGTLGRNYVRAPSFWALNTSLQRTFPIYDQLQLIFHVDAFNVFNHPNLNLIDGTLSDSTFGQAESSAGTIGSSNALYAMGAARSLQFSLKLQF